MQNNTQVNWDQPQRQPMAGLFIVFIKTLGEVMKRVWPLVLLILFRDPDEEGKRVDRYEVLAIAIAVITLLAGVLRFLFFRFYISGNELIIKKGWIKKRTVTVPLQHIQNVQSDATFLHQAFGVVKLSIDTAGSSKTEVTIDALKHEMAASLRDRLLQYRQAPDTPAPDEQIILKLTDRDLAKLSLSANHIETFFLLFSFSFGIYENLSSIDEEFTSAGRFIPEGGWILFFLAGAVLLITVIISVSRIVMKYYGFTVNRIASGFQIRSGLLNKREYMVTPGKIQAVTWNANWIRRLLGLWLLEYRIAGTADTTLRKRVRIPVSNMEDLPVLSAIYAMPPDIAHARAIGIHPSYAVYRLLMSGLLLAPLLVAVTWYWWKANSLFLLLLPLAVYFLSLQYQQRFRLWAMTELLFVRRGVLSTEEIVLKWNKIQAVTLKQSSWQRKRELATLILHTASDNYRFSFIPIQAAHQLMNYGLFKVESSDEPWMY